MAKKNQKDKVLVQLEIAIFKIPPCEDVLVIGKNASIGKNAAVKMMETIAPDYFEVIKVENPIIEALMVKKGFIKLIGKDRLTRLIVEEVTPLMEDTSLLHIKLDAKLLKTKTIEVENDSSK